MFSTVIDDNWANFCIAGKATLEPVEDSPTVTLDVAAGVKEKKLSDVED